MTTVEMIDKGLGVCLVSATCWLSALQGFQAFARNPNLFGAFCAFGWVSFACFVSASLIRDRLSA